MDGGCGGVQAEEIDRINSETGTSDKIFSFIIPDFRILRINEVVAHVHSTDSRDVSYT